MTPPADRKKGEGFRIFCTTPGGGRVLVATYELRAGTHPNLVIVPGPDGKPTLGRHD